MLKKFICFGLVFCLFMVLGTSVFAKDISVLSFSDTGFLRSDIDARFEKKSGFSADDYLLYCTCQPASGKIQFDYISKSSGISYIKYDELYIYGYAYDNLGNQIPHENLNLYSFYYHPDLDQFLNLSGKDLCAWDVIYDCTDLDVYSSENVIIYDGSYSNLPEREILLNITYDDKYSKASFSATLSNSREGDKLYYSTLIDARNNLINPIEVIYDSIYVVNSSRNGMLFFQVIDSEGNTTCSKSVYLKSLDNFNANNFDVSIESMSYSLSDYWVKVSGKYTDSIEGSYYDCYVSYTLSDTKDSYAGLNLDGLINYEMEEAHAYSQDTFYNFNPNTDFWGFHTTVKNVNCSIIFKFVNKETGYTCGYKRVDFVISSAQNPLYPQYGSVSNVDSYYKEDDSEDSTYEEDNTNSGVSGLNTSFNSSIGVGSISSIIKGQGEVFSTIRLVLSYFPDWITSPITFFLSSIVVIAIIKKIIE